MSNPYLTVSVPRRRRYSANDGYDYAKSDPRVKHVRFGGETVINPSRTRYTSHDSDFRASLSDSEPSKHSHRYRHRRSSSAHDERRVEPAYHSRPRSSSRTPEIRHSSTERSPAQRPSSSRWNRHESSPAPPPQYYSLPPTSANHLKRHTGDHQPKHSSHHRHDSDHRYSSPPRRPERRDLSPPTRYTYVIRDGRPENNRESRTNYR